MYVEIHVNISHFDEDTTQSSATCQNREKPLKSISSLNERSTEDALN